jgi:hypothetical protein
MDAHPSCREDDLRDIERRLSAWRPGSDGLNADAVLFAAGLAAGRRGRQPLVASVAGVLLIVQAIGLGLWGLTERAGRQALAVRLRQSGAVPGASTTSTATATPSSTYTPSPEDYYHLRQEAEQDPGRWLASLHGPEPRTAETSPPEPVILRAGLRDGQFD